MDLELDPRWRWLESTMVEARGEGVEAWSCLGAWWLEMNPLLKLLKKTLKLEEEMEEIWGDLGARVCLEEMGISLLIK